MNKLQAHKLLREMMDEHKLTEVQAVMNPHLTSAFGRYGHSMLYGRKIELSTKLVEINDEDRVRLTILHEIAHALTEGHHHDTVWQAKLLEIGGDGKRCYSSNDTNTVERKPRTLYQAFCQEHGNRGRTYRRATKACGTCCNDYNGGKYSEQYQIQYREL